MLTLRRAVDTPIGYTLRSHWLTSTVVICQLCIVVLLQYDVVVVSFMFRWTRRKIKGEQDGMQFL